jgi:hypothetical protein
MILFKKKKELNQQVILIVVQNQLREYIYLETNLIRIMRYSFPNIEIKYST